MPEFVVDPGIPQLPRALDPATAGPALQAALGSGAYRGLTAARLLRHKPGRRALVEYLLSDGETLLGKIRAKGLDSKSYLTQRELWRSGFPVAEPLGTVPEFKMWLQRLLPGEPATELLAGPEGVDLARRIAELAHRLHTSSVEPRRKPHTVREELEVLHQRLPLVTNGRPRWRGRIERLLAGCDRLGATIQEPARITGIHRDLYPDQVLHAGSADDARLYLLDLDLYCPGDPALDAGNFIAHLTEWSLRKLGDPQALSDRERALEDRFVELSGESSRAAVRAYTTLTLARHVHISTLFSDRRQYTGSILKLTEDRLSQ